MRGIFSHFQNCLRTYCGNPSVGLKRILGKKKKKSTLSECHSNLFKNYAYYFQISIRKMWCMS